jgi:hypothetical protein
MIGPAELAQAVSTYTTRYRGEALLLSPAWQTLTQHVRAGQCLHRGSCPVVKVSPVIVDEEYRALALRYGERRAVVPEVDLLDGAESLTETAVQAARLLGVDPWLEPGCEDPIHMDVGRAAPQDGERSRVAVRYLLRAHSRTCRWVAGAPQVWLPLDRVDQTLALRVRSCLAAGVR